MDEERPLREARQAISSGDSELAASETISLGGERRLSPGWLYTIIGAVVILIVAGLFLPPVSLGQYLGLGSIEETSVNPVVAAEKIEVPGAALAPADVATLGTVAAADFAAAEALPSGRTISGDIYTVDYEGEAPVGRLTLTLPNNGDELDLYQWDGSAWRFVPVRKNGDRVESDEKPLGRAYAFLAGETVEPIISAEILPNRDVEPALSAVIDEAIIGTLTLQGQTVEGVVAEMAAAPASRLLRATNTGVIVDTASLASLLADNAAQEAQISALVERAKAGGFSGINLDYQGAEAAQRASFTAFVENLAAALDAESLRLGVTVATPVETAVGLWDSAGQDWAALGSAADVLFVQMPLDPTAYGDDGAAHRLVKYTIERVARDKVSLLLTANAIDAQGAIYREMPHDLAPGTFGDVNMIAGETTVLPGESVEVGLAGNATPLEWDATSLTYRYTYGEPDQAHTVWIANGAALAHRTRFATRYNLRGVAVRGLGGVVDQASFAAALNHLAGAGDPPQPSAAAIVWIVEDASGGVAASDAGGALTFNWKASDDVGEYTINAGLAQGEDVIELGAITIDVMEEEVVVEEPVVEAEPEEVVEEEAEEETPVVPTGPTSAEFGDADGIVNTGANIRTGPGLGYPTLDGGAEIGTRMALIGRSADSAWYNIRFLTTDVEGWIFNSLIDVRPDFDIGGLAVVEVAPPVADNGGGSGGGDNSGGGSGGGGDAPPAPPPPPPAPPPISNAGFELGGQTHSLANPTLMNYSGMKWVKFQHKWGEGDNGASLAGRIQQAHANGFKVLLSIPGQNTYPSSINFGPYITFLGQVAAQGPDAIEVWNEMNIDFEWPAGQINPNQYVNAMLAPAYNAIKAANPNVMVISGAPAPTGFDNNTNAWSDARYMAGVAAAGGANYMDCVGVHYNEGILPPSQQSGDPRSEHYTRYFWGMLNTYYNAFGGARPLCFTELGYLSADGYPGLPSNFSWAGGTSVAEAAAWLAEAASLCASSGKVRMMIVWNVDLTHYDPNGDPQAGYAMVRPDGSCPACETLHQVTGGR